MTKRLVVALVAGWFIYAELVALLTWIQGDDEPLLAVFFGNVLYGTILWSLPLLAGWLAYLWAIKAVTKQWPHQERASAILLAPVVALPMLGFAMSTEGWSGTLFATGYALISAGAAGLATRRVPARS